MLGSGIPVGANIIIIDVTTVFDQDEVLTTADPGEMALALEQSYATSSPRLLWGENAVQCGYNSLALRVRIGEEEANWTWKGLGHEPVTGKAVYSMLGGISHLEPVQVFPSHSANTLANFFRHLAGGKVTGLIYHDGLRGIGGIQYINYVTLQLTPGPAPYMASGVIGLYHDSSFGDQLRAAYRAEGGDSEHGRGDHVGAVDFRETYY